MDGRQDGFPVGHVTEVLSCFEWIAAVAPGSTNDPGRSSDPSTSAEMRGSLMYLIVGTWYVNGSTDRDEFLVFL